MVKKVKTRIKDFYKMSEVKNPWQFLMWLIGTKEFLRFIAILLFAAVLLLISQSFKYNKKDGVSYDPVVEKVEIKNFISD